MIVGKSGVKFHYFGEYFITLQQNPLNSQMGKIRKSTKKPSEEDGIGVFSRGLKRTERGE